MTHELSGTRANRKTFALRIRCNGHVHLAVLFHVPFQWHHHDLGLTSSAAKLDIIMLSAQFADGCNIAQLDVQITATSDDELHIHWSAISVLDVHVQRLFVWPLLETLDAFLDTFSVGRHREVGEVMLP